MTAILLVVIISACNYSHNKLPLTSLSDSQMTYAIVSERVLSPRCMQCHMGSCAAQGIDLSTYDLVTQARYITRFSPEKSSLYDAVKSGRMPKGSKLSEEELSLVERWIALGAPRTGEVLAPPPVVPPPTPVPTYAYLFKNIFQPMCLGCHNGKHPKTDLDLQTYDDMMSDPKAIKAGNSDLSQLSIQLQLAKMPPTTPGAVYPLSAAQVQAVSDWIDNGAKQSEK